MASVFNRIRPIPFRATASIVLGIATLSFGQEVPTHTFTVTAPADGNPYSVVVVGGDPFSKTPSAVTVDAVLVPVVMQVVETPTDVAMFDPTASNYCDPAAHSAVDRFRDSPLVVANDLKFNGVDVGTWQYVPGFKRAEFWHTNGGQLLDDTIRWTVAAPVTLSAALGKGTVNVGKTGCLYAVVNNGVISDTLKNTVIPKLQKSGVISTAKFALFMTIDVEQLKSDGTCCNNGDHGWIRVNPGDPRQTWGWADYDTHSNVYDGQNGADIKSLSHEIAEWMNNPYYDNAPPEWGYIGEAQGKCVAHFEVGDPINSYLAPKTVKHFVYHLQEFAYFGWFFDGPAGTKYPGAGGAYSSNGTFKGPHNTCPPGGTL
jgi:hypothetical protein